MAQQFHFKKLALLCQERQWLLNELLQAGTTMV